MEKITLTIEIDGHNLVMLKGEKIVKGVKDTFVRKFNTVESMTTMLNVIIENNFKKHKEIKHPNEIS